MQQFKHCLLSATLGLLITSSYAATTTNYVEDQSIEKMVCRMFKTHPSLQEGYHKIKVKEAQIAQSRADFLPVVDAEGVISKKKKKDNQGIYNTESSGDLDKTIKISVSQTLFSGFSSVFNIREATKNKDAEQLNFYANAESLTLDLASIYLDFLEKKEVVDLSSRNLDTHIRLYKQIKQKTDQGLTKISDLIKVEGRKARAQASLNTAQDNLNKASNKYYSLTSMMPYNLVLPNLKNFKLPSSLDEAVTQAMANNPMLLATVATIEAKENAYKNEMGDLSPRLTLDFSKDWSYINKTSNREIALNLKVNLFNGGKNYANIQNQAYALEEKKYNRMVVLRSVKEKLAISWEEFIFLEQQLKYLDAHEQASKKVVDAYKEEFNIGKQTIINLLDSENELYQSSLSLTGAIYKQLLESFRLLYLTGNLIEQMGVEI